MPLLFYLDQVASVSNANPIHPNPKHPDSDVIAGTLAQTKESKMARTRLPSHLILTMKDYLKSTGGQLPVHL